MNVDMSSDSHFVNSIELKEYKHHHRPTFSQEEKHSMGAPKGEA
jgi:hypothetical protein